MKPISRHKVHFAQLGKARNVRVELAKCEWPTLPDSMFGLKEALK